MDKTCDLCDKRANTLGPGYAMCSEHADDLWAWKVALDDEATRERGGPIAQRCPRRDEMFQQGGAPTESPDEWRMRDGQLHCSYCGSLHPDIFIERIREGWVVGPTDKNYKAYIGHEREVSDEDREMYGGCPVGDQESKFYFPHLSADHRGQFIDLYNAKQMKIGYPGYFYTRPYFVTDLAKDIAEKLTPGAG